MLRQSWQVAKASVCYTANQLHLNEQVPMRGMGQAGIQPFMLASNYLSFAAF